jgi:hypothetical protein
MSNLLSNRASVAVVAALFALATWFGSTHQLTSAPTSLVLSQPSAPTNNLIAATSSPRL